ncbi:subtilase family-domain-containing protein [Obelidium mucronatum]|nr:subtilase family-domain-containing protein [Obelidium mucronatum]
MSAFPIVSALPKEETEAAAFIEHFPSFDGRGTVIAVLDTGVCPGAVGMQVTTTGQPKIVELIDCTGAGDVDMSATAAAASGEKTKTLRGLTGRTLAIPPHWPAPAGGEYRLGCIASARLFPADLVAAAAKERRARFDRAHHALVVAAQTRLAEHERAFPKLDAADAEAGVRQDLKSQIDVLKDQLAAYKDPGHVFDVVSLHDGTKWRAAIDVNEKGDFSGAELMAGYGDELKYASFGEDTRLNYNFNFYDDGNLLSIVTLSGTHGTHVAAIAAANHPTDPRQNGVAPGAQIISLKIGDSRLGSQETGQSLVRAAAELARLKPDVANISYGEPGATYDYGRCIEILQEAINKAGVIVVSAAGNAGPVLSSIGHPSGNSGLITVGAYLTPKMQGPLYALLEEVPERPFSFTSLGPTLDGAIGVDVYAPGAAITSVPEYTKNSAQLMNGTSMASPNAAGCVSALVSGLKQSKIAYNPYRVSLALRNSSKQIGDPFGVGLIQVKNSWEHLSIPSLKHNLDVLYEIKVSGHNHGRGLYLRSPIETSTEQRQSVKVKPLFTNPTDPETSAKMLEFEAHVSLVSTVGWIKAPEFVLIANGGREFLFNVDPTNLAPGLHVGEIVGYDTNLMNAGPLFKIPVTVCKPETIADVALTKFSDLVFNSGEIIRKYISVPQGCNFATLNVRSKDRVGNSNFWITFEQIHAQTPYTSMENSWVIPLSSTTSGNENDEYKWSKTFQVTPNYSGELVMCQYCTSLGQTTVSVDLEFHSLQVSASSEADGSFGSKSSGDLIFLNSGNASLARCDISSHLRKEDVGAISVVLDKLQKSLRPTDAVIAPLKSRDVLPDGRQLYELVLTYSLKVVEEGNVLPFYPRTMNTVYDNFFESVWIFVFDSTKALKSVHDIKQRPVKLSEGTYTVKMQIVSRSLEVLDKLQAAPILVNFDTKSAVTLTSYKTLGGLISGTDKFAATTLSKGESTAFWVSGVEGAALPKSAAPGDLLLGTFKVCGDGASKIDVHKVAYLVPSEIPAPKEAAGQASTPVLAPTTTTTAAAAGTEVKPVKDELAEAVRDLEISYLKKLEGEKRDALISKLEAEHGKFLPFLVARLEVAAGEFEKTPENEKAVESVVKAVEAILAAIDRTELAVYFGLKYDTVAGGEAAKTKAKEMDLQKAAVVSALMWTSKLAKHRIVSNTNADDADALYSAFDKSLVDWSQWIASSPPTNDGKYLSLWVWRLKSKGLFGSALKAINKYIGDSKNTASGDAEKSAILKELLEIKKELFEKLGWGVWVEYEERWTFIHAPPSHVLF